ncbi:MAG: Npt1/Npt2 family nucleotide transporter [Actinomycetota bacterium]
MSGVARALKIHPGEQHVAGSLIALSFVVMAGQIIGQSAATALFFDRVGTDALPTVYLLQGASCLALMLVMTGALGRTDQRRAFLVMGAALAVVVLAERLALLGDATWVYWVLWLTVALAVLIQTVFVWGIAGMVIDTRQAKRLFPLFAAGGILGSVMGGLVTAPLVHLVGAANLLLAWAGTLVAAWALGRWILPATAYRATRRPSRPGPVADLVSALRYVMRSRLLVWMTLAAVLFSVLFYSLFLPWAAAAAARYPTADGVAGFIGLFSAVTTGAAFLVSAGATNRLFVRFGIALTVVVLPLLYVGSFGILLVTSTFAMLVGVRGVTGIWLQGVASPAWETLTNVVPSDRRDQVRTFLNGGPAQAGTAIAGVIALVGTNVLTPRQLTVVGLITAVITVGVAWAIKRSYATALVDALRAGRPVFRDAASRVAPVPLDDDAQAIDTVVAAADDPSPSVRRLAVQLLAGVDETRVTVRLHAALDDDDPGVVALAATALAGRSDDPAIAERLRALAVDEDAGVRATAVAAVSLAPASIGAPIAASAIDDRASAVRASAVRSLAVLDPDSARSPAIALLQDPSALVRRAAADACAAIPDGTVAALLDALGRPASRDAALDALTQLELGDHRADIDAFATGLLTEALRDLGLADEIVAADDATALLRDAVLARGRATARAAVRAIALTHDDGASLRSAVENLDASDGAQVATALETLESTSAQALVRPLIPLWDRSDGRRHDGGAATSDAIGRATHDPDRFIAMCGELARSDHQGGTPMDVQTTMPPMERVLFLRKVPLFDELAPADLLPIAEVADEQLFSDGDRLGAEGEMGDGMHVIVSGSVHVRSGDETIAERGPGDVVGELSLITARPRMADLIADGDVRTIWITRRAFEGMVHDRPDVAIGVMRVLAMRLAEHAPERPHA